MRKIIITTLVAASALAAVPAEQASAVAPASCKAWSISGGHLVQNNNWTVRLPRQYGNDIDGRVFASDGRGSTMFGDMEGQMTGRNSFRLTVSWDTGSAGTYYGRISIDGFVTGVSQDFHNGDQSAFKMIKRARCTKR